ncbi:MAG: hypothetical protein IPH10_07805 [bacterium]|nr:hypothetical protein [bacterium]
MRTRILLGLLLTCTLASASLAKNRDNFGIGPYIGEPTGLNAQFFWDKSSALDIGAAWSWDEWFLLSADFQMYDYIMDMPREWKWYYGGGAYMTFANDEHDDNTIGVRVPLGLKYHFPYSIVDVSAEFAPGVELAPKTRLSLQGGVGVTFWLW